MKTFIEMSVDEVDRALEKARRRFQTWRDSPFVERGASLQRAAKLCRERREKLARVITLEMGKRIEESRKEIDLCARIFDYYAEHGERFLLPERLPPTAGRAKLINQALGVIAGIEPWNYPFYQVVRFAAPTLMAGNVVVLKHASNVQQCAEGAVDLFRDAGFPDGTFTNLAITAGLVNRIIDDDRVQGVSFTGSNESGAAVAARAGQNVKKTILELGGSDPFIVLEDANMESTIEQAVRGRMTNMGQSCVASKRFILVKAISDEFIDRFKAKLSGLRMGDPLDGATEVAPLYSTKAVERLKDQIDKSVAAGATILTGGERPSGPGAFIEPTILTDIKAGMPAYDEELFGPVAAVIVVPDEATAIAVANATQFGLGGSVYTADIERGTRLAEQIEAGMVFINQPAWIYEDLPFGGIKKSGYGRECGEIAIHEFVNKKLICVHE